MKKIEEKSFEWGSFYRNSELAGGILGVLIALVGFRGDFTIAKLLAFIFFLVIGVFALIHYFYLTKNKTYVSVNSDGINVASRYSKSKSRFVKWTDISKVEKDDRKKLLTMSLSAQDDVKIYLGSLNKEDRDEITKKINEATGQHPEA